MARPKQIIFTNDRISALTPARDGSRYQVGDRNQPGLFVRVGAAGSTFIFYGRLPGSSSPVRKTIGKYPAMTCEEARQTVREWKDTAAKGINPVQVARDEKAEAERELEDQAFKTIMEEYIKRVVRKQRRAVISEREIRRELLPVLADKIVTDISRRDVVRLVEAIADRPALYTAHNAFGHLRTFFNWAINRGIYDLEYSPCDRVKVSTLIGPKLPRTRVLSDRELKALWEAADEIGHPYGSLFKIAALTGQRIMSDLGKAKWPEIDLEAKTWTVPEGRFKSGINHTFPISDATVEILQAIPRFEGRPYVFSAKGGNSHVNGLSKMKARLAALMRQKLDGELPQFGLHDIRRTFRTRLASLQVRAEVAEMAIGHAKKGLQRIYDQHEYESEIRAAMEAWAQLLGQIINPPPTDNVVKLDKIRA